MWRIKGCIQPYEWGGTRYLPDLLCLDNTENKPFAEVWLGMHPACPSVTGDGVSLRRFVRRHAEKVFTAAEREKWKDELPFLCKILDVNDMLSIQLHPDKESAEKGFAEEEARKIPKDAFDRTFKDPNHKPEIMYSLSTFHLLHAFRPDAEIISLMELKETLHPLAEQVRQKGLARFYDDYMRMDQKEINGLLQPFLQEMKQTDVPDDPADPDYWTDRAIRKYCTPEKIDRSILSFYMLNLLTVPPGTVIFQDSGVPHAYLRGQTIEVMANSDNVVRGGLTPKHIDTEMLRKLIRYDQRETFRLDPEAEAPSVVTFRPPVDEFSLSVVTVGKGESHEIRMEEVSLLFSVRCGFVISSDQQRIRVNRGEAVLCTAGVSYTVTTRRDNEIFWVRPQGG